MKIAKSDLAKLFLFVHALSLPIALAGCGASNPNEAEFLRTAPPGEKAKEEKYSDRRARTHTLSKTEIGKAVTKKTDADKKP